MTLPAESFIVFSDDWGEHPSSCQHLFRELLPAHRVLWVNTIGMRAPKATLGDLKKILRKLSKMFGRRVAPLQESPAQSARRPWVCQPFMLPFSSIPVVRRFNRYSVLRKVREMAREAGIQRPLVVTTVPNACDYVDRLGAGRVVYYCVDDFTQWPGLEHALVRSMESQLIDKCDVLVATSEVLLDKLRASGKPAFLLTHGVDVALFSTQAAQEHPALAGIPHPRVGYFGLLDERTDQALLADLAAKMPGTSFVLAGPSVSDVSRLRALPNVHFIGPVAYAQLPTLIKGLDVLFLAYVVNEFTASISPLKLKEYMATGKPIIATPLAEIRQYHDRVRIAASVDDWRAAIDSALGSDDSGRRDELVKAMAAESWTGKARRFLELCRGNSESPA